jgi:ABC-2 type transport system ATP-binding protein
VSAAPLITVAFIAAGHHSWADRRELSRQRNMPNIIEVKDLKKSYGRFEAVKGISFSVAQGTTFGFLGPNGAGKSTTVKMLTTLLRPTSGTILIDGHDPATEPDAVRHAFGIRLSGPLVG